MKVDRTYFWKLGEHELRLETGWFGKARWSHDGCVVAEGRAGFRRKEFVFDAIEAGAKVQYVVEVLPNELGPLAFQITRNGTKLIGWR